MMDVVGDFRHYATVTSKSAEVKQKIKRRKHSFFCKYVQEFHFRESVMGNYDKEFPSYQVGFFLHNCPVGSTILSKQTKIFFKSVKFLTRIY